MKSNHVIVIDIHNNVISTLIEAKGQDNKVIGDTSSSRASA